MRKVCVWFGAGLCALVVGCLDPVPTPHVHGSITAEAVRIPESSELGVRIIVTNEGPGAIWAAVPCPPFSVQTPSGESVGTGIACLAGVPVGAIQLDAGERHVVDQHWSGARKLGSGRYWLTTRILAAMLEGDRPLPVDVPPFSIEILPR
jgi:hypothetical protein